MRVVKKQGIVENEARKIRPCVVRLVKLKPHIEKKLKISLKKPSADFQNSTESDSSISSERNNHKPELIFKNWKEFEHRVDNMFKGPFKKRPVNEGNNNNNNRIESPSTSSLNSSVRGKMKTPGSAKQKAKREVFETPVPTIAASRSRRSIKPNPKYASEDIVTPKMIRTGVATPALRKSETPQPRQRESLQPDDIEEFFNKDTDEDEDDDDGVEESIRYSNKRDQPFVVEDSDASDVDMVHYNTPARRGRGRPKKTMVINTPNSNSNSSTIKPKLPINNVVVKAQTPVQQIRKTFPSQVSNQSSPNPAAAFKRAGGDTFDLSDPVIKKKLILSESYKSLKIDKTTIENRSLPVARKPMTSTTTTLQLSKSSESPLSKEAKSMAELSPQERRRQILAKSLPKGISLKPPISSATKMNVSLKPSFQEGGSYQKISLPSKVSTPNNSLTLKSQPIATPRSSEKDEIIISNATATTNSSQKQVNKTQVQKALVPRAVPTMKSSSASSSINSSSAEKPLPASVKLSNERKEPLSSAKSSSDDPFANATVSTTPSEMPTFTIVNIHDIIKKKGDPLISQSSPPPQRDDTPSPNTLNNNNNEEPEENEDDEDENEAEDNSLSLSSADKKKEKTLPIRTEKPQILRRKPGPASSKLSSYTTKDQQPVVKRKVGRPRNTEIHKKASPVAKPPTILNHTLNKGRQTTSPTIVPVISTEKPAPRILNSMVAKKTEPVKPVIANLDDSADESYQLSMDEQEETEEDDMSDYEPPSHLAKTKSVVTPKSKENSSAVTNVQNSSKKLNLSKSPTEKVVIIRDGDRIIKKITCFETWFVLKVEEEKPIVQSRNQLEIPLVDLANHSFDLPLPSEAWTSKVTLYELSPSADTSNLMRYTGDLSEHNIDEADRDKYQPSCVMFRRASEDQTKRLPYDRAVIFKNKTFFVNIDGKNVRLLGAPHIVDCFEDVEVILQLVHELNLESQFVEQISTTQ